MLQSVRCKQGVKLCDGLGARLQALQTLAFGHHLHCVHEFDPNDTDPDWDESPLPTAISRLTALSSLMLHNIYWEWCPNGLPHVPKVGSAAVVRGMSPLTEGHI